MRSPKSSFGNSFWTVFLIGWALVTGALCRFLPVIATSYPINDGGLFYTMAEDILRAGYALPAYTSFNNAGIPFAYPPFGLYLAAALHSTFGMPLLDLFHWLPALIAYLAIPAFFLLAREILHGSEKAALGTAFFAVLPLPVLWLIMGGGLTRSLGLLFSLVTLWAAYRLFTAHGRGALPAVIVFGSLLVLSHPQYSLLTLSLVLATWVLYGRNKRASLGAVVAGAGILALTSPWWLTVVLRHGVGPFLAAFATGNVGRNQLSMVSLNLAGEPLLPIVMFLALLGLIPAVRQKQLLLPVWLILPSIVDAQHGGAMASVAVAMLACLGLVDFLLPALCAFWPRTPQSADLSNGGVAAFLRASPAVGFVLVFVLAYPLFNAQYVESGVTPLRLTDGDLRAASWVAAETPPSSSFLVIEKVSDPMAVAIGEWLPALTGRTNRSVVQGYEWLGGENGMFARVRAWSELQTCLDESPDCLGEWAQKHGRFFDYVLLKHTPEEMSSGASRKPTRLEEMLEVSPEYELAYDGGDIRVFQVVEGE